MPSHDCWRPERPWHEIFKIAREKSDSDNILCAALHPWHPKKISCQGRRGVSSVVCSSRRFCRVRGHPPRPSLSVVRGPPEPHASRSEGGQTWRWVRGFWLTGLAYCEVGVLLFSSVLQNAGTSPPLPRCPPSLVGFLARIWASRFASGALMKLTADLEAPRRKTPTPNKPPVRSTPGGSAEGAGGMSHALLDPQHAPPRAKSRSPNARSAPLLRRSRNTGGPRTTDREGRGGCANQKRVVGARSAR